MLKSHQKIERNSMLMLFLTLITISIGGLIEIVPLFRTEITLEKVKGMRPLTPLELAGQQIYMRENCSSCHSQQIRPLRDEVERYGHYSLATESMYDYPFLWGSKRTGPDLARVGGKYSDEWHKEHMINPRNLVPESVMPSYGFLMKTGVDTNSISNLLRAYKRVGVPYSEDMIAEAERDMVVQASPTADADNFTKRYGKKVNIRNFDEQTMVSEMDALIAYLQVLGTFAEIKDYKAPITPLKNAKPK